MKTEQILSNLGDYQGRLFIDSPSGLVHADPATLANTLLLIRGQLIHLVEAVATAELNYRHGKAAKFDQLIQPNADGSKGLSKSAAMDMLDMSPELVDQKIEVERLKNYLKYIDGLCTSVQTVIKFETSSNT